MAFALAFILGGARAQDDLTSSMLILWAVVGLALGYRLTSREAVTTGAVYGAGLGFASTVYGYRGGLLFIERIATVSAGVAVGALCGVAVAVVGSAASERIFGPAGTRNRDQ